MALILDGGTEMKLSWKTVEHERYYSAFVPFLFDGELERPYDA